MEKEKKPYNEPRVELLELDIGGTVFTSGEDWELPEIPADGAVSSW